MDVGLTLVEFGEGLIKMPLNKAPGPDGLPLHFYKVLRPTIGPTYYSMARDILSTGLTGLHSNMNSAVTSLMLKPNKDLLLQSSDRPLLINTDLKIICKAIAR